MNTTLSRRLAWPAFALLALAVPSVTPLVAQEPTPGAEQPEGPSEGPTERPVEVPTPAAESDGEAKLKAAITEVRAITGLKGEDRRRALTAAAESFEAAAQSLPGQSSSLARAWYEAGECRRRLAELELAETCYTNCLDAEDGRYVERAFFERASIRRRQKRYEEAIVDYGKAIEKRPDSARAHQSRLWIARCHESTGALDKALEGYREALTATDDPVRKIDASDRLAGLLVKTGDLDGAEQALSSVEEFVRPLIEQGGKLAERIEKALARRSAPKRLQRERDTESDAAGDAVRLERDRARSR